jgi:hypothetical protein
MRNLAPIAAAALLAACASTHATDTAGAKDFGAAVEMMQHRQADHAATSHQPPQSGGPTGTLAQQRYQTGHTTDLLPSSSSIANSSEPTH